MNIILIDFNWGQKIEIFSSELENIKQALLSCVSNIRYTRLGTKSISKIKNNLIYNPYKMYDITKLSRIYNVFHVSLDINGVNIDANIIKSKEVDENHTYTIVTYFKGGTYITQNASKNSTSTIKHWAKYLSWRYYSKEERAEIKNKISTIKELTVIIEGMVWNFECNILSNSLNIYIVKSYCH